MKKKSTIEVEDTAQLIKLNENLNKENLRLSQTAKKLSFNYSELHVKYEDLLKDRNEWKQRHDDLFRANQAGWMVKLQELQVQYEDLLKDRNQSIENCNRMIDKYDELKAEYNSKDDELTKSFIEIEKLKSEIFDKRSELMVANSMHTVAIEKPQELDKMKKDFEQTLSQVGVLIREKKELQERFEDELQKKLDDSDFFVKHLQSIISGNNSSLRSLEWQRNLWVVLGGASVFITLIILAHAIFG